jgi:hypothetical protein
MSPYLGKPTSRIRRAIALDRGCREMAKTDDDLAWARQDPRVRRLLGLEEEGNPSP